MGDEIRKPAEKALKAITSLSEISIRVEHNGPSAEKMSHGENTISAQPASQRLDSHQENKDPNASFTGAQPNFHEKGYYS